jgi:hypothetical protein
METFMMATGKMIELMDMGSILTPMELNMKATGSTISSMDKVRNTGLMVLNMREITNLAKRTAMDNSFGLTNHHMPETS